MVLSCAQSIWIIEFYSDHCPFCKSLAPELLKAARTSIQAHGDKIRFGGLNTRIFNEVGTHFGITGFPWVACFFQVIRSPSLSSGAWVPLSSVIARVLGARYIWNGDRVACHY